MGIFRSRARGSGARGHTAKAGSVPGTRCGSCGQPVGFWATDWLTGLPNRWGWEENAHGAVAAAEADHSVALLLVDVDRFKLINDTVGHAAGDMVLQAVANVLRQVARDGDVVSRYGGDEFIVLLHPADGDTALTVASDIHQRVRDIVVNVFAPSRGGPTRIRGQSVSIGLASGIPHPDVERVLHDLFLSADDGLLAAKRSGRGRTCATVPDRGRDGSSEVGCSSTMFDGRGRLPVVS